MDDALAGPLVALCVVGLLMLMLRWTFSRGHSLVSRRPRRGHSDDYGLLVVCAHPRSMPEGEMMRLRLRDAGIRATLTLTADGLCLFVWPEDEPRARELVRTAP